MLCREYGHKNGDQHHRYQHHQYERSMRPQHHFSPLIPARKEIDKNAGYQHYRQGQSNRQLLHQLLAYTPVFFPVINKFLFVTCKHIEAKIKHNCPDSCISHLNYIYCGYNPKAVKIPSLLAQYLYGNQRLDLPGIGSFLLDNSSLTALQQTKQRSAILDGVSFQNNSLCSESSDLVSYIAEKTGKMRALAAADLDSHLQLALQFLNMGKPFSFEGIGILTKVKAGEYEFTPISVLTDKIKEQHRSEIQEQEKKDDTAVAYESFLSSPKTNFEWRKPVLGLLLVCGIGLTVWGGYVISRKKSKQTITASQSMVEEATTAGGLHTANSLAMTDSVASQTPAPVIVTPEHYKYILEVAQKKRAFKRFNQLKELRWKVELETQDSVQFKIFMQLPLTSDTTRTIDSLRIITGRKVHIEYPR